jgi:hypothetical protein
MAWGRVDDELRWAPWLCRIPMPGRPAMSAAEAGPHAQKLYSLFAKDRAAYVANAKPTLGQVIVKESYLPHLVPSANELPQNTKVGEETDHFQRFLKEGDKVYKADELVGLYLMWYAGPAAADTDAGWLYATLVPEPKPAPSASAFRVTAAGKIASCMECHQKEPTRLFGVRAKK